MDCRLFHRPGACTSSGLLSRLEAIRQRDGRFVTAYEPSGQPVTEGESISWYGAFRPTYARLHPDVAERWSRTVLGPRALVALRRAPDRYYDANWVWFGLGNATGRLAGLTPAPTATELN